MRKFSGQAWHGPIASAICSTCGGCTPTSYGQSWVNQLVEWKAGVEVRKLDRFQCGGCSEDEHASYKAKRKAELAAEPRCEVPGCSLLKAAQNRHQSNMSSVGGLGLFLGAEVSGANVLAMVEGESE